MLRNKQKAQGMVEFALILPLLLLLLVGVIEAARIIWAYMTVQTAAREAARYAISGRPYINPNYADNGPGGRAAFPNSDCLEPEGTPGQDTPWACHESLRVEAIKMVAMNRISSTMPWTQACDSPAEFAQGSACENVPGALGVLVVGQFTDPLTPSVVLSAPDHPGEQGLNVKITAFYNVQMIDPIFDAIVKTMTPPGRNFIQLKGELSMQNEGIDEALGGVPPPAIDTTIILTGTGTGGTGPSGEQIWALNYRVGQGGSVPVHLENHFNTAGPYDIYLSDGGGNLFKICELVNTLPATNNGDFSCPIGAIPAGFYTLFSTLTGSTTPLATAPQQVEVTVTSAALVLVENSQGDNIVTPNTNATITLLGHQLADQPFDLFLVYGAGPTSVQIMSNLVISSTTQFTWLVPTNLGNPCPPGGGTPCTIQSRKVSDGSVYGTGELYITSPQIVLGGGNMTYAQGEIMFVYLRGHTPGQKYHVKISDGGANTRCIGITPYVTNASGDTTVPIPDSSGWPLPQTGWPTSSSSTGIPNGTYTLTSHPADTTNCGNPGSMTSANQVAILNNVQVNTPSGPFLTVDGGYTWPAGSFINIRAHQHVSANNPYYFRFGAWRVPIAGATPADTFNTTAGQSYVTGYRIPLTATTGVSQTFAISSFINAGNVFVAQRNVTVSPVPVIAVLEGSTVLPDTVINIRLTDHAPNSSHRVLYNGFLLGEVLTDNTGRAQMNYDLETMSQDVSSPANPSNYGIPFPLYSQLQLTGSNVATTQLTIRAADLQVTNIQFPANPALNTNVPVTFTLRNSSTVPISRFFDIDLYLDPSPQTPAYQGIGQINFPGDFKLWRNAVAPGATFTINQPFFIGSYGPHRLFSYGDTSDFLYREPSETNNILSNTLTITCTPNYITDTFASLPAGVWTTQLYGNADNAGTGPAIASGRLRLRSDGSSSTRSNDNSLAPQSGYTFFRRTTPITSAGGLDVRVQVFAAPNTNNGSKAGLELRDTTGPTSPKIEFGLTRSGSGQYRIQAVFRDSVSTTPVLGYQNATNLGLGTPIWLRIQRYGGTNTFLFYFVQSAAAPTNWGAPVYSTTVRMAANQLEYGVFMNNAASGGHEYAEFDNFVYGNPGSCPAAQGQPPDNNTPPGLTICTDPLVQKSFENPPLTAWILGGSEGVTVSPGSGHTGNFKLSAPTFDSQFRQPFFYQQFAMPTFVISTSTNLNLALFKNINNLSDGDDANDRFFAVVTTGPSLASTQVTNPTEIANGIMGAATYNPTDWRQVNVILNPALGVNLETYAGQNLYLHFYNQSNAGCVPVPPFTGCHATQFNFDDVTLSPCTTQPLPPNITTHLKGELVLHRLGGSTQKIAGVKVSAYSEGGQLYETVTIQNGEFNFYNLPATPAGTTYFLYAEYFVIDALNPNQIEILAADSTAVVSTANTSANPALTRLDLFTISP